MLHPEVKKLIDNSEAVFICSHSGGKDSQAQYLYLKSVIPAHRLIVVHADLSEVDWQGTEEHILNTIDSAHQYHKVKAPYTFLEMVERRGMFPSSKVRQCTKHLKNEVITNLTAKIMAERGITIAVNCMGIRAEESPARAARGEFHLDEDKSAYKLANKSKGRIAPRYIYEWNPIFNWSTRDVFSFIKLHNQLPHWAYLKGMSRLSCCFCIMSNRTDMKIAAKYNPEMLDTLAALEEKIGHTAFMHREKPIGIKEYINTPYIRTPKPLVTYGACQ